MSVGIQIKQGLFYFITASAESVLDLLCGRGSVSSTPTVKDNQVKKNKYCCVIVLLEGSVFCFFSFFLLNKKNRSDTKKTDTTAHSP